MEARRLARSGPCRSRAAGSGRLIAGPGADPLYGIRNHERVARARARVPLVDQFGQPELSVHRQERRLAAVTRCTPGRRRLTAELAQPRLDRRRPPVVRREDVVLGCLIEPLDRALLVDSGARRPEQAPGDRGGAVRRSRTAPEGVRCRAGPRPGTRAIVGCRLGPGTPGGGSRSRRRSSARTARARPSRHGARPASTASRRRGPGTRAAGGGRRRSPGCGTTVRWPAGRGSGGAPGPRGTARGTAGRIHVSFQFESMATQGVGGSS